GGDGKAYDAPRVLRIPGTVNYPDERKRAKGRTIALADFHDAGSSEMKSSDWFSALEQRGDAIWRAKASVVCQYKHPDLSNLTLSKRVEQQLALDPDLKARYDGDGTGLPGYHPVEDPYDPVDMSFAAQLADRICRDDPRTDLAVLGGEIEAAL